MELSHLLILGAPRSGTTLLATMISRHTEIAVLNEDKGWALRSVLGKSIVGNKRCVPNQIELKKRRWMHFRFLKDFGIAKEYQSSKFSIEDYLTLPHIKVIGLIRNGDDVISSVMGRSEKKFRVASYRWRRSVEIIHELANRFPKIVLIVCFEDLVLRPKENMERIAAFLDVEYQDRMLEGPRYNPWYPEQGMNLAKVNRAKKEKIDFKLSERFPETVKLYQELLKLSEMEPPDAAVEGRIPAQNQASASH
ncbi:MAG TPA: sulfotransferase [Candidatus Binatia bacterium]|nr:sulfotransferase [Candidatus Binatia bacterium]